MWRYATRRAGSADGGSGPARSFGVLAFSLLAFSVLAYSLLVFSVLAYARTVTAFDSAGHHGQTPGRPTLSTNRTARTRRGRVTAGALLIALVSALGSIALATPAQAHNYLVSSTPAADSTLTELPEAFDITTNDALLEVGGEAGAFAFQVLDADGRYYGDGCVTVAGPTMTATPALGAPGPYTVRWQVLSADGHLVSDEFTFTWAPIAAAEPALGSGTAPVCGQAPAASAPPSASAAPSESSSPIPETTTSPSTLASGANVSSDDTRPTVLWIGGVVIALAAAVVITLLITGRKKST